MNGSEIIQQSSGPANPSQERVNWLAWFGFALALTVIVALVWRAGGLDSIVELVKREVPNPNGWR